MEISEEEKASRGDGGEGESSMVLSLRRRVDDEKREHQFGEGSSCVGEGENVSVLLLRVGQGGRERGDLLG